MGNYAFVHFSSREEAERILREKNGLTFVSISIIILFITLILQKDNEIELTWAKPIGQKRYRE